MTEFLKERKGEHQYKSPRADANLQEGEISGYELAAWCYCTFMESFPSMMDKLHLPYAMHYEKAKELVTL